MQKPTGIGVKIFHSQLFPVRSFLKMESVILHCQSVGLIRFRVFGDDICRDGGSVRDRPVRFAEGLFLGRCGADKNGDAYVMRLRFSCGWSEPSAVWRSFKSRCPYNLRG